MHFSGPDPLLEIVELPTVAQETTVPPAGKGKKNTFD